jgi:hypothetical protein
MVSRRIHLVLDNLSTHSERCVVDALGARAGRALWRRFVVHYAPKHASWLNAAEMEASPVSRECLGTRRIDHLHTLKSEVAPWRIRAERDERPISWKFTVYMRTFTGTSNTPWMAQHRTLQGPGPHSRSTD